MGDEPQARRPDVQVCKDGSKKLKFQLLVDGLTKKTLFTKSNGEPKPQFPADNKFSFTCDVKDGDRITKWELPEGTLPGHVQPAESIKSMKIVQKGVIEMTLFKKDEKDWTSSLGNGIFKKTY